MRLFRPKPRAGVLDGPGEALPQRSGLPQFAWPQLQPDQRRKGLFGGAAGLGGVA